MRYEKTVRVEDEAWPALKLKPKANLVRVAFQSHDRELSDDEERVVFHTM